MNVQYPGVYIQELPEALWPIDGVPTSVTAFLGSASHGIGYRAIRVRNFGEFEQQFGGLALNQDLGYAVQQFFLNGGADAWIVRIPQDLTFAEITRGLQALGDVDIFNLLAIPGVTDPQALLAAAEYCRQRRAFLIVDSPRNVKTPEQMAEVVMSSMWPATIDAAVYFPWIMIPDSLNNGALMLSPPSGTMAGVFARTDATRGVWKAPSGSEATLSGVAELEYKLNDEENQSLSSLGVNCLRSFSGLGIVAWGARTLVGDSDFKYIPPRRLVLFLEESIYRGTKWAVFEPNAEPLWAGLRLSVETFLDKLFREGAFYGSAPRDAYFVRCDSTTTSQSDIDEGVVNILVGFAPIHPAEFVVITISQTAGQKPS
jgi:phage tail sheath protein FI